MPFLPFAGRNSIVEALFGVQFAQPIVNQISNHYDELRSEFTAEFPKFEQMHQVSLTLGAAPMNAPQFPSNLAQPTLAGFNAALFRPNGTPIRVLRGFANSLSTHFLEYERWNAARDNGLRFLERCLTILNLPSETNPVVGIQMIYIDRFTFDGNIKEATTDQLAQPNTRFLPQHMLKSSGKWQNVSTWRDQKWGHETDNALNIQGVVEQNAAVVIIHDQTRWLAPEAYIRSLSDMMNGQMLTPHLDALHEANASILKDFLTRDMLVKIGLT